ncbi:hypothetical protein G6F22_017282 [Rhizopus arrhizus]|nr:hypothetical protein G6F22_017282 [Rhizopus arrhizus]
MLVKRRQPLAGLFAVLGNHRQDQVRLGRKMMMDAGLADMAPFGHIGIAEPVIAAGSEQQLAPLLARHGVAPDIRNAANLLVGRLQVKAPQSGGGRWPLTGPAPPPARNAAAPGAARYPPTATTCPAIRRHRPGCAPPPATRSTRRVAGGATPP